VVNLSFLDDRQKRTGWLLIVLSAGYLVWFLKTRLLTYGLPIERKEWIYFVAMIVLLMLGTANVRLALRRQARQRQNKNSA